jgi:hypothetical protein
MALFASQTGMPTGQWEVGAVVIERGIAPFCCVMTSRTIPSELTFVSVACLVAGIAICRGPLENVIFMAGITGDICMCPLQLEDGEVMVK